MNICLYVCERENPKTIFEGNFIFPWYYLYFLSSVSPIFVFLFNLCVCVLRIVHHKSFTIIRVKDICICIYIYNSRHTRDEQIVYVNVRV